MKFLRNKSNLLLLTVLIFLMSCNNKEYSPEIIEEEFPSSIHLAGNLIPTIESLHPGQLALADSLLIVAHVQGEAFFDIYNTHNNELITSFGTKGRGPAEFDTPMLTLQEVEKEGRTYHLLHDVMQQEVTEMDFRSIVKDEKFVPARSRLPGRNEIMYPVFKLMYFSDSLSITYPMGADALPGRFKIERGGKVKTVGFLPELPFTTKQENLSVIYTTKGSAVSPERNKMVVTGLFLGQYDFFDLSGEYLYSTVFNTDENLHNAASSDDINQEPSKVFITEIRTYNDLIYSLCTTSPTPATANLDNSKIHVLDWEGRLIKEYVLDRPLKSFVYDEENQSFYGLAYTDEVKPVFKYTIPKEEE